LSGIYAFLSRVVFEPLPRATLSINGFVAPPHQGNDVKMNVESYQHDAGENEPVSRIAEPAVEA
jgi:hypothetical protein